MYLYGKNSIIERLNAFPGSIKKVFVQDNFRSPEILDTLASSKIPVRRVSERDLIKMKKADRLQGIVAEVEDFKYVPFEELLGRAGKEKITLVFLDNISDPHNLGSIMRITACFGGFAVVIPKHDACEVNETAVHVASGGENFTPVAKITNMTNALIKAKNAGFWIVGTVVEGGTDINDIELPFPLCLVLGSEGKGIRHGVMKQIDFKASLPMRGAALSFNVAMACAIFGHEVSRQRAKLGKAE